MGVLKKYYVLIVACGLINLVFPQKIDLKFNQYSIDDGLSQNTINTIFQDNDGFLWLGTDDGLNRFDGFEFDIFRFDIDNTNSLSNNQVTTIHQDQQGDLWVGTINGLNKLNLNNDEITRYYSNNNSISNNHIRAIKEYGANELWIGTNKGISIYNTNTASFTQNEALTALKDEIIFDIEIDHNNNIWIATEKKLFLYNPDNQSLTTPISIEKDIDYLCLTLTHNNNLWIGTSNGCYIFNIEQQTLNHHSLNNDNLSDDSIIDILEDKDYNLWIASNKGLLLYDTNTNVFYTYTNRENNPKSLSYDNVFSLYQDQSGIIWIGTYKGLNSLLLEQKKFNHFSIFPKYLKTINSNLVWKFNKDKNDNLWIATDNGLHIYDERRDTLKTISKLTDKNISKLNVYTLKFDQFDNLWIGGQNGVYYLTKEQVANIWSSSKDIKLQHFNNKVLNEASFVTTIVKNVAKDEMWIGTLQDGIIKVNNLTSNLDQLTAKLYVANPDDKKSLISNSATIIIKSPTNDIWIGTQNGLNKYNYNTYDFEYFNFHKNPDTGIEISSLNMQNDSILWVGSFDSGLIKFNTQNFSYEFITTKDGFSNNSIYSILFSNNKEDIWVSSNKGISKYNIATGDIRNYLKTHGLQDNEFGEGSSFKDRNGKLYFGGINGFNSFYPDSIQSNKTLPKISITELKVFNKVVSPNLTDRQLGISNDNHTILTKSIAKTDTITMSSKHSVFTFKVSILHFQNPSENKFAYKLVGLDKNWNIRKAINNQITYTNLDPGIYRLQIKAANSDGEWSDDPKQIIINIKPRFWQTSWFYTIAVFSLAFIIFFLLHIWKNQIRLKERRDFLKKENEQKTNMLKEIHHRVKNNLHVVNSLLRIQSSKIKDKNIVQMFKRTQSRVLSMAILHEKMYQSKNLNKLNAQEHFEPLIRDLIEAYGIDKDIDLDLNIIPVNFPMETLMPLGLILNELISNSLKHAFKDQRHGIITIHLKNTKEENFYELIVGDNGNGIQNNLTLHANQIGTRLIQSFIRQLNGSITHLEQPGTFHSIIFQGKE